MTKPKPQAPPPGPVTVTRVYTHNGLRAIVQEFAGGVRCTIQEQQPDGTWA